MYTLLLPRNGPGKPATAMLNGFDQPEAPIVYWGHDADDRDTPEIIVLKVPGFKYFSGLYQPPSYARAKFQVYRVTKKYETKDHTVIETTRIAEFPVKSEKGETE